MVCKVSNGDRLVVAVGSMKLNTHDFVNWVDNDKFIEFVESLLIVC